MCMPFQSPATSAPSARAMAIPSPVLKRARGASSGMLSPPGPKCSRIMSRLPWKPPQASTTASAERTSPLLTRTPRMPLSSPTSACAVQCRAAADGLDARRAFGEIIGRLVKLDAVRRDPLHRRGRIVGEAGEVALVALEPRRRQHIVHEARLDAVRCRHAHIGRCPAGVAAGLVRRGLVEQRDGDGQVSRTRLLDRRQRGREPRGTLADDDDFKRLATHVVSPVTRQEARKRHLYRCRPAALR
jgi:hypothetical protein